MLRIGDRHERELLYGPTNEEMVTDIFRTFVRSYKALPLNLYHIQWKFRDEVRPRFGTMRSREFLMKGRLLLRHRRGWRRRRLPAHVRRLPAHLPPLGLVGIPMRADTGPIGGNLSYEFHVLAETGESGVFLDKGLVDKTDPLHRYRFPWRPLAHLQRLGRRCSQPRTK